MKKSFETNTNFEELYELNGIISHKEVTEYRIQCQNEIKSLSYFEEDKNVEKEIFEGYEEFCNKKIDEKIGLKEKNIITS